MQENKAFQAAAIQMVSGVSVESNLASARTSIAEAAKAGAQLVVLPEYFCIMGRRDTDKLQFAEAHGSGPIQDFHADQARQHGLWLFGGTLPLKSQDADRIYNALLVCDPEGRCRHRYDKIHLFGYRKGDESYDEAASIRPGQSTASVAQTTLGKVGLSVC